MVAPAADGERRAAIYARIGEAKRAQGKPREAELNFEKAFAADPSQREALDALVEIATESREPRRAIEWRRRRLGALKATDDRLTELLAIARAQAEELGDTRASAQTLEEAHAIDTRSRSVLLALRAAYEKI